MPTHDEKYNSLIELRDSLRKRNVYKCYQNVVIGDYTYFTSLRVWAYSENEHLTIGKFCSIGDNVQIMLGGEHRTDWVTTYPFNALMTDVYGDIEGHPKSKGDVIIGNDVWIGNDAKIMSGVKIGDGAVIGANAIVTHDVQPYTIVGGVPAKEIRKRFSDAAIRELLRISWWNWDEDRLAEFIPVLQSENIIDFIKQNKEDKTHDS